ncbi:MAG: DNA polymerase III subunit gamma/tau [Gammaproteobacteria bacterium]|nr:DNA polymerase III subunit gamma/tau [Gammaproteobacteria bacterium]
MSYLVLARKWRPGNFAETVGQEHVLKALTNALDSQRLHHAYLFTGTRGVGKTTIARILAKALNCEQGISAEPCGECTACAEIDEGRFVDLIEVDAASKTKVDDTRELLDNVQFAPARARFKVYLIDEVHMLSGHSFNALLKTLEEPPPHVKFLLATTDPQKLPVTVLSRCLQFNLKRLTPKLIRDHLAHICAAEDIKADAVALAEIARSADGSMRDALSLLDQAIAFCGGDVSESAVADMLGTIDRDYVLRLLKLLADGDGSGLLAAIADIDESFPDYSRLLGDLARSLQRIAVYQVVGSTGANDQLSDAEIAELAARIPPEDVQLFYQTALIGGRDLALAPDPRSGAEMCLLRMLVFRPQDPVDAETLRRTPQVAKAAAVAPAAVSLSTPEPPAAASEQTSTRWVEPVWSELVGELKLTGTVRLLASNCAYLRRDGNVLALALDSRSESLLTRSRQQRLEDALEERFGERLALNIAVGAAEKETPVQQQARLEDEKLRQARVSLESDPNVQALQDMFGAELKPESIEIVPKTGGQEQ